MHVTIDESKKQTTSKNKIVMECVIEHARITGQNNNALKQINFVRMKKQVYLPIELVGTNGKIPTECRINVDKKI